MEHQIAATTRFWKGFWQLADPKIWVASLIPFILGNCLAISHASTPKWSLIFSALLVLISIEIGKNGLNEYFDYLSGADRFVAPENRTPFSGGKKVIVDQILSMKEVLWISIVSIALALVFAIPLVMQRPWLLLFGMVGTFFSVAYSLPPLQLSYRGLGELAVGFTFGPVIVNGAYFMQTGRLALDPVLLSLPLGFLIANVLWINEIPDVEADRRAKKWNLVARLGRKEALSGYILLLVLAYGSIILAALLLKKPAYLLALTSGALVPNTIRTMSENLFDSQKLMRANGFTIVIYLLTGILLSAACFIGISNKF